MDDIKREVKQVFISNSSRDEEKAFLICRILERHGIPCWFEFRDLEGEKAYGEEIFETIHGVTVVLMLFSENSNHSKHVANEMEIARKTGKVILPLRMDATDISPELDGYLDGAHWMEASPWNVDRMDEVLQEVQSYLPGFTAREVEEKEDKRYNLMQNGQGNTVLLFNYRNSKPDHPEVVYDGKRTAVIHRNVVSRLEFGIGPDMKDAMDEAEVLTVVEVLEGTVARQYEVPVKRVPPVGNSENVAD